MARCAPPPAACWGKHSQPEDVRCWLNCLPADPHGLPIACAAGGSHEGQVHIASESMPVSTNWRWATKRSARLGSRETSSLY